MAARRSSEKETRPRQPPATTPEELEDRLIAKAYILAEKQLEDGTASAQVQSHFLRLGSSREKLEQERIRMENELTKVKMETLASEKRTEELVQDALRAFVSYTGQQPAVLDEEEEM